MNRHNAERQYSVNRIAFTLGGSAGTVPYYGAPDTSAASVYGHSAQGTGVTHTGYGRATGYGTGSGTGYGTGYGPLAQAHGLQQQTKFHIAQLLLQGAYPVPH